MSQQLYSLSLDAIKYICNLINQTVDLPSTILDDLHIATNTTYSSYKLDTLLKALKEENIEYCDAAIAGLNKLSKEIITDKAQITNENTIYLLLTDASKNIYEQWLLINGTPTMIGTTEMKLDNVYTKDEADARYTLITDFNSLKTKVDGKVDKTSILTAIDNLATDDQVYSASVMNTELDKKANKTDIEEANIVNLMPFPYDSSVISKNSGIIFKVDDEGVIHVSGTKTTDNLVQYYPIRDTIGTSGYLIDTFEVGKTYTLSGCPSGGSAKTYHLRILFNYDKSSEGLTPYQYMDNGEGITFTIQSEIKYMRIMIDYMGVTDTTYGDLVFKPQITESNKVIDFKTSLNRNNLSQLKNTITSTINGLNGRIPITYGEDMDNITAVGFYSVLSGSIALNISNLPVKSACFVDVYGNNHTVGKGWLVQEIKVSNSADAPIYRRSRVHEGNWGQWYRLCTTKVADVAKTNITAFEANSNYEFNSSIATYFYVKNGICYVQLGVKTVTANDSAYVPIYKGVPVPEQSVVLQTDKWSNSFGNKKLAIMVVNDSGTGVIQVRNGEAEQIYLVQFSYPVAES